AKSDGEGSAVAVFGGARATATALAASSLSSGDMLPELRRPDDLARKPRAAIEARYRRPLGRGHHMQVGKPRPFGVRERGAEKRLIDITADPRADGAAERRAAHGRAENVQARGQKRAAERRARSG